MQTGNPSRAERAQAASVSATEAKNEFGRVLEQARREGAVYITRHERPQAVLVSLERFEELSAASRLDALSAEFDQMLEGMQTGRSRAGMKRAFRARSRELGKAALAGARKPAPGKRG
jgi:prevent-host-death family protein